MSNHRDLRAASRRFEMMMQEGTDQYPAHRDFHLTGQVIAEYFLEQDANGELQIITRPVKESDIP